MKTNPDIFTSTFIAMRHRLVALAQRLLSDDNKAEDMLQEAFCRLWSHRSDINTPEAIAGMAVTTVRNLCIDDLRYSRTATAESVDILSEQACDESESERQQLYDEVMEIINNSLDSRERLIIDMRDIKGLSYKDIAAALNLSEPNVRMILSRARCKIRDIYNNRNSLL